MFSNALDLVKAGDNLADLLPLWEKADYMLIGRHTARLMVKTQRELCYLRVEAGEQGYLTSPIIIDPATFEQRLTIRHGDRLLHVFMEGP